jgi:hypothetical protein
MNRTVTRRRNPSRALQYARLAVVGLLALAGACACPASAMPADGIRRTLTVFVDPDTHDLDVIPGPGRVALELSLDDLNALDTSADGLTPTVIGDMVMLDLRGRYRPVWVVVAGADGTPHAFCLAGLPASVEAAAQAVREEASRDR